MAKSDKDNRTGFIYLTIFILQWMVLLQNKAGKGTTENELPELAGAKMCLCFTNWLSQEFFPVEGKLD